VQGLPLTTLDHVLIVRAKKRLNAITIITTAEVLGALHITTVADMMMLDMKSHTIGVIVMAPSIGGIKTMRETKVEKKRA